VRLASMESRFEARFASIENRLVSIDDRFGRIEGLLIQSLDLRERMARIEGRVSALEGQN
jgi:hypothetical protein